MYLPLEFDIDTYKKVTIGLSLELHIWRPPGSPTIRIDKKIPEKLSKRSWADMICLNEWLNKTDPEGGKRLRHASEKWYARPFGEEVVII